MTRFTRRLLAPTLSVALVTGALAVPAVGQEFIDDVAAELGIPSEELEAAVRTVAADRLEEALAPRVEDGLLTQEQLDELVQAVLDGDFDEVAPVVRLEVLEARLDQLVAEGVITQEKERDLAEDVALLEVRVSDDLAVVPHLDDLAGA